MCFVVVVDDVFVVLIIGDVYRVRYCVFGLFGVMKIQGVVFFVWSVRYVYVEFKKLVCYWIEIIQYIWIDERIS